MEILPGRRPPVSLVLGSSTTLAWTYSDETTEPICGPAGTELLQQRRFVGLSVRVVTQL
jgi:hypothetical protein